MVQGIVNEDACQALSTGNTVMTSHISCYISYIFGGWSGVFGCKFTLYILGLYIP